MTKVEELPPLPPDYILALGLPWMARRMVGHAESYGEGVLATVVDLLKFVYRCGGLPWVDPREVKEPAPDPNAEQVATYRRWLIPVLREVARGWCEAGPGIIKAMFDDTRVEELTIDGYTILGYDKDGYDKFGFDSGGKHRDGRLRSSGMNAAKEREDGRSGVPQAQIFDRKGLNQSGFDKDGYDEEGYDERGYNKQDKDRWGNLRSDVEPLPWQDVVAYYDQLRASRQPT